MRTISKYSKLFSSMGILLLLLLIKRAAGLLALEVDCGGSVTSDFCLSCPPSASGCGGECGWVAERSLCIQDKGRDYDHYLGLPVQTAASLPGAVPQIIGLRGQGPALELYPEALGNMTEAIYFLKPDTPNDQVLWSRPTGSGYFYYYESTTPNKYNTGFISTKERVPETFQTEFMWEAG